VGLVVLALIATARPSGSAELALPDNRAYELVSPPSKNGADVLAASYKTHVAADGNGATFATLGGFGSVHGTSTDVEYLSRRDGLPNTNGWSTHAINPLGGSLTLRALIFGNVPTVEAAFTPDLTATIYQSWRPLTDAPNVRDVLNLYRLRNLDSSALEVQLLSDSAAPLVVPPFFPDPQLVKLFLHAKFNGASTDLSHVIFQTPWNLADGSLPDFTGNLYEYADGVGVRLVARVPSGLDTECDEAAGPACVDATSSQAGISNQDRIPLYSAGMISDDGSRIVFQTPVEPSGGAIYMRENGTHTFQLNASEKVTPDSPQAALAWGMTPDGSRVFFTTGEALLDGAQGGLYMWDRTAPPGSRLTWLSGDSTGALDVTGGFIGASADGSYVYFLANRQIVPGEPSDVLNGLFMWHDGHVTYIGRFSDPNEAAVNTPRTSWATSTYARPARVSPDGRFLLFGAESDAGFRGRGGFAGYDHGSGCSFTAGGTSACRQLYLYRADTARLVCVSCNPRSSIARGEALTDAIIGAGVSSVTQHFSHALSDDGRRVFFSTSDALVPQDSNERWDAYEYDVPSGTVHLLSSGKDPADSYFLEASASGDDAFIVTHERLVGWDVDENYDLYDVRVGGGFLEPPPATPQCAGDACRPQATPGPAAADGASVRFRGAGNVAGHLKKHKRCKRRAVVHRVRGKRKCVHRRRHRHAQRSRAHEGRRGR
jgi:hypothetical protein